MTELEVLRGLVAKVKWHSICSAHQQRDPECPRCEVGNWCISAGVELSDDELQYLTEDTLELTLDLRKYPNG